MMKRYKNLFAVLLTIFALAFIVFVGFMQQKFNNPEFTDLSAAQTENTADEEKQSNDENDAGGDEAAAGAAGAVGNDEEESQTDETAEVSTSTRTVLADSLYARSGPGVDYEIAGLLVLDQTVQVEDSGNKWVKVITSEFTGYVNEKYLSEE